LLAPPQSDSVLRSAGSYGSGRLRPTAAASGKGPSVTRRGKNSWSGVLYILLYHTGHKGILYIWHVTVHTLQLRSEGTAAHARETEKKEIAWEGVPTFSSV
jgi:hypothetical protein